MLARKFPALRAGIILSSKRKPPLRLSASGGRRGKPGIKNGRRSVALYNRFHKIGLFWLRSLPGS